MRNTSQRGSQCLSRASRGRIGEGERAYTLDALMTEPQESLTEPVTNTMVSTGLTISHLAMPRGSGDSSVCPFVGSFFR